MPTGKIALAAIVWLLLAQGAAACETQTGRAEDAPLRTRRPVMGDDALLVSGFGMRRHPILQIAKMHTGVDWAAPTGTPVIAAAGGRVVDAGVKGEYGNYVRIDHGGGWQTAYAHLSTIDVSEGDCVAALSVVGRIGSTGLSTGPRLHFEVLKDGRMLDPMTVAFKGQGPEADGK